MSQQQTTEILQDTAKHRSVTSGTSRFSSFSARDGDLSVPTVLIHLHVNLCRLSQFRIKFSHSMFESLWRPWGRKILQDSSLAGLVTPLYKFSPGSFPLLIWCGSLSRGFLSKRFLFTGWGCQPHVQPFRAFSSRPGTGQLAGFNVQYKFVNLISVSLIRFKIQFQSFNHTISIIFPPHYQFVQGTYSVGTSNDVTSLTKAPHPGFRRLHHSSYWFSLNIVLF